MSNERESALAYLESGNEFMVRQDWLSATHAFRAAIRIDPTLSVAHAGLGAALGNQGLWEAAVDAHRQALKLAPDDVDIVFNLGVAYGELARSTDAESYFRRVLEACPADRETRIRLGTELAEQERFAEALEQFQKVIQTEKEDVFTATACACAGAVLIQMGRTSEARESLHRARALNPALFEERPDFAQLLTEVGGH